MHPAPTCLLPVRPQHFTLTIHGEILTLGNRGGPGAIIVTIGNAMSRTVVHLPLYGSVMFDTVIPIEVII